jgi:hypothetical protein
MTKDDARRLVLSEWDQWSTQNCPAGRRPSGTDGMLFFTYLEKERPHTLSFRDSGDRWQTVHGWLLRAGKVAD